METYTRDEQSLLLYLETCLVDQRGLVQSCRMNEEDFAIAKAMNKAGLIEFKRRKMDEIKGDSNPPRTHTVRFTNKAWLITRRLRRERAERHVETIE